MKLAKGLAFVAALGLAGSAMAEGKKEHKKGAKKTKAKAGEVKHDAKAPAPEAVPAEAAPAAEGATEAK